MKYGDIVVYNNEIGKVVRDNETDTFRFLPCGHGSCYFSTLDIITEENSFCNYGVALLEIDIPDDEVKENQLLENDRYNGKYIEYITDEVSVQYIKTIYIPKIFKERIDLPENILSKITWCGMKANYYGDSVRENCPDEVLKQFAKTAEIMDASEFNFFRGVTDRRTMIDLYDIQYVF